jgi:PAS domain S-box-containing protein
MTATEPPEIASRVRYLEALNVFSKAVYALPNVEAVLDIACSETCKHLGCAHVAIFFDGQARTSSGAPDLLRTLVETLGAGERFLEAPDVQQEPALAGLHARAKAAGVRALVDLPLDARDRHLGHWALYFDRPRRLDAEEREIFGMFTEHLANAVLNAQVMEDLFNRAQRLSVTYEISRELNSRLDLSQVLRGILEMSVLSVKADSGSLVAFDQNAGTLAAWELDEGKLSELPVQQIERMLHDGLAGWVLRNRQTAHIPDTSQDTRWLRKPGAAPISALSLPLLYSGDIVGVMTLVHSKVNAFTYEDLELLNAIADQAALAVQNARLYRAAESRAQQLSVLNEVSRLVTSTLDLNSVLELIVNKTLEILGAEAGSVILVEGPQRDLVFRVTSGSHTDQVAGIRLPWGTGLTGKVAAEGQPFISNDVRNDPRWFGRVDDVGFMRAMMILPLVAHDNVVGVLTVINKRDGSGFTPDDIELISSFAGQAAIALENARLFSSTDEALARRVEELSALETITREIASSLDLREVIDVLLLRALAVTHATRGVIGLVSEDGAALRLVATHGFGADDVTEMGKPRELGLDQGLVGRVVRTGQAVLVSDARQDPDFLDWAGGRTRSVLGVPIIYERKTMGAIELEADSEDALGDAQAGFLKQLADHAALAIQNARLHRETETQLDATTRANRRIQALQDALGAVQSALGLDEVLQRIANAVVKLGYEAVFLAPYDEVARTLEIRAVSEAMRGLIEDVEFVVGQKVLGTLRTLDQQENIGVRSFLSGETLVSNDMADFWAPTVLPAEAQDVDFFGCGASLPLRAGGRAVGNMFVFTYQKQFKPEDLDLLQAFAGQAGVALDKARLFTEVSRVRDRLQTVLNSVRDGIGLFSADGRLTIVNPAVHELLGVDLAAYAVTGDGYDLTFDALQEQLHTAERLETITQQADPQTMVRSTLQVDHPRRRYLEQLMVPVYDGPRLLGWLAAWHDVTNQKELEQTREEFTHMLVHDLRSPLGAVIGGLSVAEELLETPEQLDAGMLNETVNLALDGSRHLLDLINSILDINKLESGSMPLDLRPVALAPLAEDVVRTLMGTSEITGVKLSSEVPADLPPAQADRDKVHRVVTNLVANALKFTPSGKSVTLRVRQDDGKLVFMVADEGPGIPPDYRSRVFEKFVQVPGSKGRQKGTGLGLTFCKLTIEAHGGRIWVDCPSEGGSVFTFTLPVATEG